MINNNKKNRVEILREEREHKFRLLFVTEFYDNEEEFKKQIDEYMDNTPDLLDDFEDDNEFIEEKEVLTDGEKFTIRKTVNEILEKIPEIDEKINRFVTGWTTDRMDKADLNILRLAVYEIFNVDEIPEKVSINEAVNLAKKYGSDDSGAFVNGVLARIVSGDLNTNSEEEVPVAPKKPKKKSGAIHIVVNKK